VACSRTGLVATLDFRPFDADAAAAAGTGGNTVVSGCIRRGPGHKGEGEIVRVVLGTMGEGQGLTLVHISAQPEPVLVIGATASVHSKPNLSRFGDSNTPASPQEVLMTNSEVEVYCPQKVRTLSSEVDECKPLVRGCAPRGWGRGSRTPSFMATRVRSGARAGARTGECHWPR